MTNEENKPQIKPELPEGIEKNDNLNPDSNLTTLGDGTQILHSEQPQQEVEENENISDEDLQKLVAFTTGVKNLTSEELESLRNDDKELERLIKISMIKARSLTYNPKKHFGKAYKKARQRKNKVAKASRRANR